MFIFVLLKYKVMPRFRSDDIEIDVSNFLDECDKNEIKEVIAYLVEKGHLSEEAIAPDQSRLCASEYEYIKAIDKLRNKWTLLAPQEEEQILIISKRF
jgi:hypothetical protein